MRRVIAIAAAAVLVILLWRVAGSHTGPVPGTAAAPGAASPISPTGSAKAGTAASAQAGETSELAARIGAPGGDIHSDLRALDEIFAQYRSGTRGLNPVGENREITAALTGRNSIDFTYLPRDHPSINAKGELCDRWGTPFFFHQLSGTQMEIRSAGPDRTLWTDDDIVFTPVAPSQPQR